MLLRRRIGGAPDNTGFLGVYLSSMAAAAETVSMEQFVRENVRASGEVLMIAATIRDFDEDEVLIASSPIGSFALTDRALYVLKGDAARKIVLLKGVAACRSGGVFRKYLDLQMKDGQTVSLRKLDDVPKVELLMGLAERYSSQNVPLL